MEREGKWLQEATNALSSLLSSVSITELDRAIFGSQVENVSAGQLVALPDCVDIEFKRIRSNRLKLLGYQWQAESKSWIKIMS